MSLANPTLHGILKPSGSSGGPSSPTLTFSESFTPSNPVLYFVASTTASVPRLLGYGDVFSNSTLYLYNTTNNTVITSSVVSLRSNTPHTELGCYVSGNFFVPDTNGNILVYTASVGTLTHTTPISSSEVIYPPVYDATQNAVYTSYTDSTVLHIVKLSATNGNIVSNTTASVAMTEGFLFNTPNKLWIGGTDFQSGNVILQPFSLPSYTTGSAIDLPDGLYCVVYSPLTGKLYVGNDTGAPNFLAILLEVNPSNSNIDYTYDLSGIFPGTPFIGSIDANNGLLVLTDNSNAMAWIDLVNRVIVGSVAGNLQALSYMPNNSSIYVSNADTGDIDIYS